MHDRPSAAGFHLILVSYILSKVLETLQTEGLSVKGFLHVVWTHLAVYAWLQINDQEVFEIQ